MENRKKSVQQIVDKWPQWKKEVSLTKYSSQTKPEKMEKTELNIHNTTTQTPRS